CFDSHLIFLSLVFRVLAPHPPTIPIPKCFPIYCRLQTYSFPASSPPSYSYSCPPAL
ncbi:unnamed protein product, partial [Bubo scandiacus]